MSSCTRSCLALVARASVVCALLVAASASSAFASGVDLSTEPTIRFDGAGPSHLAGSSVAPAGDVNAGGCPDVIVGAPRAAHNFRPGSGSAYVLLGESASGAAGCQAPTRVDLADLGQRGFRIDGAAPGDAAGTSVAGAGDVNGDGLSDLIVGAPDALDAAGSAYVVFGRDSTTPVDLAFLGDEGFSIMGAHSRVWAPMTGSVIEGDRAGWSVAGAGDVNGDTRADLIVGAPSAGNNNSPASGSVYVVFGKRSTDRVQLALIGAPANNSAGFRIDGAGERDEAGTAVAGAVDVNGGGRPDVLLTDGITGDSAYVVFGEASAPTIHLDALGGARKGLRIEGGAAAIGGTRDMNKDGRDELVLGRPWETNPNGRTGSAYVIFGTNSTSDIQPTALGKGGFRIDGPPASAQAPSPNTGQAVAAAGDFNGDHRPDVIVGAPEESGRRGWAGAAYVVFGKRSKTTVDLATLGSTGSAVRIDGAAGGDAAGSAVGAVDDLDGDRRSEVIVGAPYADPAYGPCCRYLAGSTFVVFGRGSTGS